MQTEKKVLTEEELAELDKYCLGYFVVSPDQAFGDFKKLIRSLQAERAKLKDDVWQQADSRATMCEVYFYHRSQPSNVWAILNKSEQYTRTLPKTLEQEIADKYFVVTENKWQCIDALKEYAKRLKE